MNRLNQIIAVLLLVSSISLAEGFKVKASGSKSFTFFDKYGKNQVTFFSKTPLEDITGTASGIKGEVNFDVNDFKTLTGKITVDVSSMKTGIDLRDEHLFSDGWLDAEKYPEITFKIKSVKNATKTADNRLTGTLLGSYTMKGVTKDVEAGFDVTYLDENEQTKMRAPGDLLGVRATFNVKLSDYGVEHMVIGSKVAEDIEVSVNVIGYNK
ncbi:YceI family protein [Bacteroidota bacterium]